MFNFLTTFIYTILLKRYMNDIPRTKYEIIDLIFTILIAICLISTAIFLLSNLIVSLIYSMFVAFFAFVALFLWISRNPFAIYLIRTFVFNNFIVTLISLIIFLSNFTPGSTYHPGYILLLFPSGIYILISFKYSNISLLRDKRAGIRLSYIGRSKAAQNLYFKESPEERSKREELIAEQKKTHNYKPIVALSIALILSSLVTLIFGFY